MLKWIAAAAVLLPGTLAGHSLQVTGVTVRVENGRTLVSVVAHAPMFGGADPAADILRRLKVRLDGEAFRPSDAAVKRDATYDTVTWTAVEARVPGRVEVLAPVFPEQPEDNTVVLVFRDGVMVDKTALNGAHPSAIVGESVPAVLRRFVEMGFAHILSGPDHVLFVLGLILAGGTLRRLLAVVSAFTVAHSITLSLTALGVASLSPRFAEPMIALSIVVVGLENVSRRNREFEFRVWLAFGFGFFHGFGFAGALTEAGLPAQAIGWSLGAFNVGVELGQGCVVLLAAPVLALVARRSPSARQLVTKFASVGIAMAGAVWFAGRVWG